MSPETKEHILRHIVHVPEQFGYGYWDEQSGVIGVTPELLFETKEGFLRTMALAGTSRVDGPSLLDDEKEMHEHNLVVQDLLEKFKSEKQVSTFETSEWKIRTLKHLLTQVEVELGHEKSTEELVKLIHPTPALGVFPSTGDWKWLKELCANRGRFGAPFGFSNLEGASRFVVAIRNIQWTAGELRLGSGCGYVEMSDPQKEWQELKIKRDSVKALLGL